MKVLKEIQCRIGIFCERDNSHPTHASIGHAGIYAFMLDSEPDVLGKRFIPNHENHIYKSKKTGLPLIWTYSVYPEEIKINDQKDLNRVKRMVFLSDELSENNSSKEQYYDFDQHTVTTVDASTFSREVVGIDGKEGLILTNLRKFGSYHLLLHNCVAFATQEYTRITGIRMTSKLQFGIPELSPSLPRLLHEDILLLNNQIYYDGIESAKAKRLTPEVLNSDDFGRMYDLRSSADKEIDDKFDAAMKRWAQEDQ